MNSKTEMHVRKVDIISPMSVGGSDVLCTAGKRSHWITLVLVYVSCIFSVFFPKIITSILSKMHLLVSHLK